MSALGSHRGCHYTTYVDGCRASMAKRNGRLVQAAVLLGYCIDAAQRQHVLRRRRQASAEAQIHASCGKRAHSLWIWHRGLGKTPSQKTRLSGKSVILRS